MSPGEIIRQLESNGVHMKVVDGNLRMSPPNRIQPELLAEVKNHKEAIIRYLADRNTWHALEADWLLQQQGWVAVTCRELDGSRVLWTLDKSVQVPPELANLPTYTMDELARINHSPNLLRATHAVKVFYPGTEVVDSSEWESGGDVDE